MPPAVLVQPVADPYKPVTTTEDLISQLSDYRAAFDVCRANMDGVAKWRDAALQSVANSSKPKS